MTEETLYTTQAAGDWLHEEVPGESSEYWQHVLINNRRTDRNPPHKIAFTTMGRAAVYTREALRAFAEFEKLRRIGQVKLTGRAAEAVAAFGIGTQGGSALGRVWKGAGVALAHRDGVNLVQVIINEPLTVFVLSAEEAMKFGRELIEVGEAARRQGEKS